MSDIVDVSPTKSNTNLSSADQSVIGRMLSFASSPDGKLVLAGSYSNLWRSTDGGQSFEQVTFGQPPPGQFGTPKGLGGWCVVDIDIAAGWSINKHPRLLADVTGDRRADIVGFGDGGVWTAISNGDGSFQTPKFALANLGYNQGWRIEKHPRLLADLTGKRRADIIGFGDAGVWTALSNGDGTFQEAKFVVADFGFNSAWRVDKHPRFLADLTGDGRADIVGFGDAGVWTALGNGDGTFQPRRFVIANFGVNLGWRVDKHPRFVVEFSPDSRADILGFGDAGVWTSRSNGDGTFQDAKFVIADFGVNSGWRVDKHPRFLADLTGDGRADIVGFGDAGVWTALGNGDGTFQPRQFVIGDLGYNQGWRVEKHPRFVADLTGDGRADIVGFGEEEVWTALSNGDGSFQPPKVGLSISFTQINGWGFPEFSRQVADLTGDGRADIAGFGAGGVLTALSIGDGIFQVTDHFLTNFTYFNTVLVITRNDRETKDSGIWRSANDGFDWERVHQFPYTSAGVPPQAGQLVRAPGNDHMVYAAGGTALAVSRDGGVTFQNALPLPSGPFQAFNHIAVASAPAGTAVPPVVYCLGDNRLFLSLDGGTNWVQDQGTLPPGAGGSVGTANSRAPSVLVVSPKFPFEVYLVTNDRKLFRGGFSGILGTPQSNWVEIIQPNPGSQDSGNIFLVATQPGAGNLLFYSPQRSQAFVGPLDPANASDWVQLDQGNAVHVDLHGIFLSPDFVASFQNGSYQVKSGTVWLLSDGGVYRSTDGGKHFQVAQKINTLSCVNIAGAAIQGAGPAISLNTGDNDGFYSMDGGAHWSAQDYGGGDNDCSYADPLRPHSMLIYTPRWDKHGHSTSGKLGQTVTVYETSPGHLPDARSGTSQAHTVLGPPLSADGSSIWNAGSFFGLRGSRPMVLNLQSDDPTAPGDYVFIRFKNGRPSVLLRTRNILGITSRNDWDSNPALVTQQGPALPVAGAGVVQASGGHSATVFYVGGDASNQLWKWTNGMKSWKQLVPGGGAAAARRFFVNPYDPNLIYALDNQDVKRSDDGGTTWHIDANFQLQLTNGGRIPVSRGEVSGEGDHVELVLTDMLFDPFHPLVRFAVGEGGAFLTVDGVTWSRLLDTGGLPGRPINCYYDWISDPANRALYVAFAGRSLVKIRPIPIPLPTQKTVPFVVNEPTAVARQAVLAAGLVPKFTGVQTPNSFVSAQSPAAGNLVPAGSTVTMVLHKGPVP